MPKIKVLPTSVINLIAAGEVVERPAIVVKELLENSLDAGATQVTIQLTGSGRRKVVVSDNGHGIDKLDLPRSLQRHSTSKIRRVEDLDQVTTLGFRGEALASIAAMANIMIETRTPNTSSGHKITVHKGEVSEVTPIGRPIGTTVTVDHLFAHIPARLKFLKSPATELRHCVAVVIAAALSHPEVGFHVTHEQKQLLTLPPQQTFADRVLRVLNQDVTQHFLPLEFTQDKLSVQGYLGKPQAARHSQHHQYLFVNARPVAIPLISKTIKDAFGSLLTAKAEPSFILALTIPPAMLDVNIHPRKETIKFTDETAIRSFFMTAAQQVLKAENLTYHSHLPNLEAWQLADKNFSPTVSTSLKNVVKSWHMSSDELPKVWQLHRTYLVTETKTGVLIVDQHAAHERILYEQFLATFHQEKKHLLPIKLAKPELLELSVLDFTTLVAQLSIFEQLGFELEPFGNNTLKVTQVPALARDHDLNQLFQEILDDLQQDKIPTDLDQRTHQTITYLACRSAIRAGDTLTETQAQQLLTKLSETPNQFTCPHGRPTTLTLSQLDLEKMFHRR